MTRQEVVETILPHREELEKAGVTGLVLFGSVARGEEHEASDVDLISEWTQSPSLFQLGGVQYDLQEWLGVKVDLMSTHWMKESKRERFERDAVRVF